MDGAERLERDVVTWKLVAAVAATAPVDWVIETHGGGGQYDTVQIRLTSDVIVHVNGGGHVHVDEPDGSNRMRDLVGELRTGASTLEEAVGWITSPARPIAAVAASTAFMAEAIEAAAALGDGRTWEWRSGWLDMSDWQSRRDELFGSMPTVMHACNPGDDDLFDRPEYRYWFLIAGEVPVIAVDHRQAVVFTAATARDLTEHPTARIDALAAIAADSSTTAARRAAAARPAFAAVARTLAERLIDDPESVSAGMSGFATWFTNDAASVLLAIVGGHEDVDVVDEVLAYALAWQGDADLVLVLPEGRTGLTLERLAFIATPVRVFTYGADRVPVPAVVPAPVEVLQSAATRPLRTTTVHDLGATESWVADLLAGVDDHWALVPAHRSTYRSWHCRGRQVLRVERSGGGVKVTAGVAYGQPGPGQLPADVLTVTRPLAPEVRARIEARIATAVHDRFSGTDRGHVEHRMQAALAATGLVDLKLADFAREYPAWRGEGRPGYLDFLGIDDQDRLHVVETKVGTGDVKGVLQTLDYAIWVAAHGADIRADRHWHAAPPDGEVVVLDFVLAPKGDGPAIGPYFLGQVEAIDGSIPWRVFVVADPMADAPTITAYPSRTVPGPGPLVAQPVRPPRWAAATGTAIADAT